ncbi:MAG TPA: PIN domain-containing protein [Rhizobiaceae bacterium]|nr:PIN domain-containing protein [Rhizobiaceae bacterium]
MAYLFDTSVAIELRDGDRAFRSLLATVDETPSISVISRVELEGGVYANAVLAERRRKAVDALLREFIVLDFTDEMAEIYGTIVEQAGFSRRKITDRMIAATALAHDLTLVTLNGRDFRDVPGLELVEWERPEE